RDIRQAATAQLRGRRRRGDQLHRRRYLAPFAALPQTRRQASGLRRHRRLRSQGGSALRVELRAQDHRLEQIFLRRYARPDGAHRGRQDAAGDRQGAAARSGARGTAPDPGPRGHRQGRDRAMSEDITLERVQALFTRAPYHQWLGLKVVALYDDGIELKATWREEWVVNSERRYTQGGGFRPFIGVGGGWGHGMKNGLRGAHSYINVYFHLRVVSGDPLLP